MSNPPPPSKAMRARRAKHLRLHGLTWEQVAETWIADHPELPRRIAFRWAHNLSHQEVAERWNQQAGGQPTITKARIYEFEVWPAGGRRLSVEGMRVLAQIYCTSARNLLTDEEFALFDTRSRKEIESIDYRSLDENQSAGRLVVRGAEASAVTLINRPRITHLVDGKEMALVSGGSYVVPSSGYEVQLAEFFMDVTPVSNDEYSHFIAETGHKVPNHWVNGMHRPELGSHPVVNVTIGDAQEYAKWAGKRLPTAAEWERAARGDNGNVYPWGDSPSVAKCNVRESAIHSTTPVGKYRSGISPFGMHDMSGNVWEWCNTETEPYRFVLKGGAFTSPFEAARSSAVNDAHCTMFDDDTGFRCVCSPREAMGESGR